MVGRHDDPAIFFATIGTYEDMLVRYRRTIRFIRRLGYGAICGYDVSATRGWVGGVNMK